MLKTVKAEPSLGKFRLLISKTDHQTTVKEFKLLKLVELYPLSDTYLENSKNFLDPNFTSCKQQVLFSMSNNFDLENKLNIENFSSSAL